MKAIAIKAIPIKSMLMGLSISMLATTMAAAMPLEEQFQLMAEGESEKIRCFEPSSPFLYCLKGSVYTKNGIRLVDKQGNEVYQFYYFDNGLDPESEGLYRIRQGEKIGYANAQTGEIVIEPIYDCAHPFENGKADVGMKCEVEGDGEHSWWVGGEWQEIVNPLKGKN
ncbi:TPA: WG repeat-containing protein [Providencia alcalifaciens]